VVAWIAFGVALVVVVLVLGYCGYQVGWRAARLRADLAQLKTTTNGLQAVAADLRTIQARIAGLRTSFDGG
jgi:Tfp pilus assembly protein PilO